MRLGIGGFCRKHLGIRNKAIGTFSFFSLWPMHHLGLRKQRCFSLAAKVLQNIGRVEQKDKTQRLFSKVEEFHAIKKKLNSWFFHVSPASNIWKVFEPGASNRTTVFLVEMCWFESICPAFFLENVSPNLYPTIFVEPIFVFQNVLDEKTRWFGEFHLVLTQASRTAQRSKTVCCGSTSESNPRSFVAFLKLNKTRFFHGKPKTKDGPVDNSLTSSLLDFI